MGPLIPQPHLLMQIVVKQDQVEVPLQALQRPLPDTVLTAASLGGGEERLGGKDGVPGATPFPSPERQELSLRNPQNTISPPFITQSCQAGNSSKHLTLSHLLGLICGTGK